MEFNRCTGSVRVVLLVLMTAGFSAIWSNDQKPNARPTVVVSNTHGRLRPAEPEFHSLPAPAPAPAPAPVAVAGSQPAQTDWVAIEAIPVSQTTAPEPIPATLDECLDFPRELAPGEFRIRNRHGEWLLVTVTKVDDALATPADSVATVDDRAAADGLKQLFDSAWTTLESPMARVVRPLQDWLRPQFDLATRPVETR